MLRVMVHQYYNAESPEQKNKMAQSIRDYSKIVRELWELHNIKSEAIEPEAREEFRGKVFEEVDQKTGDDILEPFE